MKHWIGDIGLLALRVMGGLGIATHGYGKLFTEGRMDGFVETVAGMGFPLPVLFAWLAALSEFAGGILLAVGLATRYTAFLIFGTMTVAAFVAHAGDPFAGREMALLYWSIAIAFMGLGGGRLSIDHPLGIK